VVAATREREADAIDWDLAEQVFEKASGIPQALMPKPLPERAAEAGL